MFSKSLFVSLSDATLRRAEEYTQQELDGGYVVPGSLRNVSQEARARHAAFWAEIERRQAMKDRRPARVLQLVNER